MGNSVVVAPNSGLMLEIVARSASERPARPSPANSTNAPTTPNLRSISVMTRTRSVAVAVRGQLAVEADAHDPRHRLVERLAQEDGLGLDAADAVAQDAEPVDHRGVGVGSHERVRERDAAARVLAVRDDRGEELQVDLVDDAGARRHDPQVAERGLRPAQELVALAVALVLAADVEGEGAAAAPRVDLDRVVDDEVRRDEGVHARRVAAERGHRVAHRREVHDRGHAGEVLEDDAGGHERDLGLAAGARTPGREGRHVLLAHDAAAGVAERVLEQDLEGDRRAARVHAEARPEPARADRRYRSGRPGPREAREPNALGVVMR